MSIIDVSLGYHNLKLDKKSSYKYVGFSFCLIFNEMTGFLFNRIDFF